MKKIAMFLPLALFLLLTTSAFGDKVQQIEWTDLSPQDNSAALSEEEQNLLMWVDYLQMGIAGSDAEEAAMLQEKLDKALALLNEEGLDIDKLNSRQRDWETQVNTGLNGKKVRLPGFLLPLSSVGGKVSDFLLVPYFGACIHSPPPPPNQIVYASLASDAKLSTATLELFEPVWVTGTMKAASVTKDLDLVDGTDNIDAGYSMLNVTVEPYDE